MERTGEGKGEPGEAQGGIGRRELLIGAGAAAAISGTSATNAVAQMGAPPPGRDAGQARPIPPGFDAAYAENAIAGFLHTSLFAGERPFIPMIDETFSKQSALPYDLWGLLYDGWAPDPDAGTSVFLTGLDKRGPDNRRKRIYISALTPDLYRTMYAEKVEQFWSRLFEPQNEGKPLMRRYLDHYFDLFWDLHLGVKPGGIPPEVRQIGESFNTVIAYRDPTQPIVYENYMKVRALRGPLMKWVSEGIQNVMGGKVEAPEKTFVYYWSKNGGGGEDFRYRDVVFECFHNFGAVSQWGDMLYNIMLRLEKSTGDASAKAWFKKTMEGDFDDAGGGAFTPLERYTMELFRIVSSNGGSISSVQPLGLRQPDRHGYAITPQKAASYDPRHWKDPLEFDPTRYESAPVSDRMGEEAMRAIGFAKCPFEKASFAVKDGRKAEIANSGFGTVYGVAGGKAYPVCDYAGYAPFGFGYRRCPGELFTIAVFGDLLKKVWADRIEFGKLDIANPEKVPAGITDVAVDIIGFRRA